MSSKKYNTVILGGGLTGLSCAYRLKGDYIVIEKESEVGGLCRSMEKDGFTFDCTGHLLHIHAEKIKNLIFEMMKDNISKIERAAWIYSQKTFTKYPYQLNLYGLPRKTVLECVMGIINSQLGKTRNGKTKSLDMSFYEWSLKTFGEGITRYFLKPYNEKIWKVSLRKLTAAWVGKFVPTPKISDVIMGAFSDYGKKIGYNAFYYYPKNGGIQSLIDAFAKNVEEVRCEIYPQKIDIKKNEILLSNGESIRYENLVSTIPLPELMDVLSLKKMKGLLNWTSVLCFNIGIKGLPGHKKQWIYFPERKYPFYRVGFYSNINDNLAPKGHYSIYVEVSHNSCEKPDVLSVLEKSVSMLVSLGLLSSRKNISTLNVIPIKYAYVIYDAKRKIAMEEVQKELKASGIHLAGRYGSWKYSYMEESIFEGLALAEKINNL